MAALKYSRQREAILLNLRSRTDHPTADLIYEDLRTAFPSLSLGTVYRNLALLCDLGEIRRLPAESGADRFDARCDDHDHFACRICGAIIDMPPSDYSSLLEYTKNSFSGRIENCHILWRGVCGDCCCKSAALKS